jgi:Flp pilus assembly protein TadD
VPIPDNRKFGVACAAALALLLAAYGNHFRNAFHFDDAHTVENNLAIRSLANVPRFFTSATYFSSLPTNQSYRPLVTTTLALDYALGGLDPLAYHVDSFLLFALQLVVMGLWLYRLLGNRWTALFAAALYGVHAANAETVNYVIARSEILSTLLVVTALWARSMRWRWYLLPAALAMLAKESAIVFGPLLVLQIACFEKGWSFREALRLRALRELLVAALPAFAVTFALAALAIKLAPTWNAGPLSASGYRLAQPQAWVHYLLQFVVPLRLAVDTDWKPVASWSEDRVLVSAAIVAALLWGTWRLSRRAETRPIAFGLAWFFVCVLPTSFVPLSEVMNDHRMYLAFVGLALAVAATAGLVVRREPVLVPAVSGLAVVLLLAHGHGTHARNRIWASDEALWRDAVEKCPDNGRAHMNLGVALMGNGDLGGARPAFERALELAPNYGYAHVNLAVLLGTLHDDVNAESHFKTALVDAPEAPGLAVYYAHFLHERGRDAEAAAVLRDAVRRSPTDPMLQHLLLTVLQKLGLLPELEQTAQGLLRVNPADAEATAALAVARARLAPQTFDNLLTQTVKAYSEGRFDDMLRAADATVQLQPASPAAHNNRCSALNALKRYREAADACRTALGLDPTFQLARNNLAAAEQELKK